MVDFKTEYREKRWVDPFPQYARKHTPKKYPMNKEIRKIRDLELAIFQAKLYGKRKQLEAAERERAELEAVVPAIFVASMGDGNLVLVNGEPLWTHELRK